MLNCNWEGEYEDLAGVWLRWCDRGDKLIPTGRQQAEQARQQAVRAEQQAAQAQQQAREAEQRAAQERAERLRAMGMDPDQ